MSTPLGLTSPATLADQSVDTALVQKRWNDSKLYMESLQEDPLFNSMGVTNPVKVGSGKNVISMPRDAFFIDCTPKDKKGKAARSVELIFLAALDDDPIEGRTSLVGSEATLEMKFTTAYANDWKMGVTEDTYGIDFRELELAYGVYGQIRPLLGQWLGELRGYYARAALNTNISPNLTSAPISLTAGLNPNWFFPELSVANQPDFSATADTFENNVGAAAASTTYTDNRLTVPTLLKAIRYAQDTKYIMPAMIGNSKMYGLFACPDEFDFLRDPSQTNSWGRYWRDVAATEDLNKVIPGTRMVIAEELAVARDPRYSTMTLSGNASDYTLTFGYLKCGRTTTRATSTGANYFNVNPFLGAGALVKYEPEPPHYENQDDSYKQYEGTGLFGGLGYLTPRWNLDSGDQTDNSMQQESSMMILTGRN